MPHEGGRAALGDAVWGNQGGAAGEAGESEEEERQESTGNGGSGSDGADGEAADGSSDTDLSLDEANTSVADLIAALESATKTVHDSSSLLRMPATPRQARLLLGGSASRQLEDS